MKSVTERIEECVREEGPIESWRVVKQLELPLRHVHGIRRNLERQGRVKKAGVGEKPEETRPGTQPPLWEIKE